MAGGVGQAIGRMLQFSGLFRQALSAWSIRPMPLSIWVKYCASPGTIPLSRLAEAAPCRSCDRIAWASTDRDLTDCLMADVSAAGDGRLPTAMPSLPFRKRRRSSDFRSASLAPRSAVLALSQRPLALSTLESAQASWHGNERTVRSTMPQTLELVVPICVQVVSGSPVR